MAEQRIARILIVDDEIPQMKALCGTLQDYGYDTVGMSSAGEALKTLQSSRFDLLLSDLMMPEMSGIELLQKALEIDPQIVGIIMTGRGTIDTAVDAMKTGALDYILKPFKLSVILPVLSRAMAVKNLRRENAELEKRVDERTRELEAANFELEAFAHSVSHDLRAPLRHIDGFAGVLAKKFAGQVPAEAQHLLELIHGGAVRMSHLIDDLLRFSRVTRQPLESRPVCLCELVGEIVAEMEKDREGRDCSVVVGRLDDCLGDAALLKQVFVNLIGNALKYTRKTEHAEIEIGCTSDGDETVYYVRDNGAGFDAAKATNLFGVFQRLHRDEEFEGTGVGLSIVKRIVQRHGGRIWAEGEVGKGATFYLTIPGAAAAA